MANQRIISAQQQLQSKESISKGPREIIIEPSCSEVCAFFRNHVNKGNHAHTVVFMSCSLKWLAVLLTSCDVRKIWQRNLAWMGCKSLWVMMGVPYVPYGSSLCSLCPLWEFQRVGGKSLEASLWGIIGSGESQWKGRWVLSGTEVELLSLNNSSLKINFN